MHLHQRPLGGDNVVRLSVLVDEPGVGLDPFPAVVLGQQSEHGEAALSRLDHWESHESRQSRKPRHNSLQSVCPTQCVYNHGAFG